MDSFFIKHKPKLGEKEAMDVIVHKAKKARKYFEKDEDYEQCLRELSAMIDDFFLAKHNG